jgi:subtilisin-like proprotein convertase family protein
MYKTLLTATLAFTVATSLGAQTFTGTGAAISDNLDTTYFIIPVSGLSPATINSSFGLEQVCIDLTHTKDRDLDIYVESPDGTIVELTTDNGDLDDNYTNTCFRWDVQNLIINGVAPFTGSFKPEGNMPVLNNGQNGNGNWRLRIYDDNNTGNNTGNLISWSVTFSNTPAANLNFTSSNLPIVIINTGNQSIPDDPKMMVDMGIIWNANNARNYMTDQYNHYNGKAGIEVRGSSSQMFPKKGFGLELWDVNGNAIDSSVLGMPKESDWILSASYSDKSLMNNVLSYHLARQMGWYAPRTVYVELVIDGQYQGVYVMMEKIKRDDDRVDVANLQVTDISGSELTGGYIIKIDKGTGNGGGGWTSNYAPDVAPNGQTIFFQYEYPADDVIVPQQEAYIQAYVDSFETALNGANFADPLTGYAKYIDVNSFVDYFLLNEISRNVDGYRLSTYLYKEKITAGNKLYIGPAWDYDIAWGNADYCSGSDTSGWAYQFGQVCGGDYWQVPFWWTRLMQDPAFRDKVRCRWEELKFTALSETYLHNWCDTTATWLSEGQQRNFQQWPILGTYVWPNPSPQPATYQGEVDELKQWITSRRNWMDANMPGTLAGCNPLSVNTSAQSASVAVYPNPSNGISTATFTMPAAGMVQVKVLDIAGREVMPPVALYAFAGANAVPLNLSALAPGNYFICIHGTHASLNTQLLINTPQ